MLSNDLVAYSWVGLYDVDLHSTEMDDSFPNKLNDYIYLICDELEIQPRFQKNWDAV